MALIRLRASHRVTLANRRRVRFLATTSFDTGRLRRLPQCAGSRFIRSGIFLALRRVGWNSLFDATFAAFARGVANRYLVCCKEQSAPQRLAILRWRDISYPKRKNGKPLWQRRCTTRFSMTTL
ncbi:protein of unknown function [Candidatus Filomicrobium marinum]|nr:protein of unknown function [Candidatus Filomicrobium marinum]